MLTHVPNTHAPQGGDGWNLLHVMDKVVLDAKMRGDAACVTAANAVVARLRQVCWSGGWKAGRGRFKMLRLTCWVLRHSRHGRGGSAEAGVSVR